MADKRMTRSNFRLSLFAFKLRQWSQKMLQIIVLLTLFFAFLSAGTNHGVSQEILNKDLRTVRTVISSLATLQEPSQIERLLIQLGFPPNEAGFKGETMRSFRSWPDIRKLEAAYRAAETANKGSGQYLLNDLLKLAAKRNAAITADRVFIENVGKLKVMELKGFKPKRYRYQQPPTDSPKIQLPQKARRIVRTIVNHTPRMSGGITSLASSCCGINPKLLFRVMQSSQSYEEVVQWVIKNGKIPKELEERLEKLVEHAFKHNRALSTDKALNQEPRYVNLFLKHEGIVSLKHLSAKLRTRFTGIWNTKINQISTNGMFTNPSDRFLAVPSDRLTTVLKDRLSSNEKKGRNNEVLDIDPQIFKEYLDKESLGSVSKYLEALNSIRENSLGGYFADQPSSQSYKEGDMQVADFVSELLKGLERIDSPEEKVRAIKAIESAFTQESSFTQESKVVVLHRIAETAANDPAIQLTSAVGVAALLGIKIYSSSRYGAKQGFGNKNKSKDFFRAPPRSAYQPPVYRRPMVRR